MTKRLLFIFGIFIVTASATYTICKPNSTNQARKALKHLKDGDLRAAEVTLNALSSEQLGFPLNLYKSYVSQAAQRFQQSELLLQLALKEPLNSKKEDVLVEIVLAQILNAYFEHRDHELSPLLETASKFALHHPYLPFYEGLTHYIQSHYQETLRCWSLFSSTATEKNDDSEWMGTLIEKLFPLSWRQIHTAHCLIETGDLLRAREILERESHASDSSGQLPQLAALFLGLSYVKEAQQTPFEQRASYYKLARFYFERSGNGTLFSRERSQIVPHLEKEALILLASNISPERRNWGFDLIRTLHEWSASTAIEHLAESMSQNLLKHLGEDSIDLCQSIRQEFSESPFHLLLTQKLLAAMTKGLKEGDQTNLFDLWTLIESLSPKPRSLAKEVGNQAVQEIYHAIRQDENGLRRTNYIIEFWEKLDRSTQEKLVLSRELLRHGKLLWQKEGQEVKAQKIMGLALRIGKEDPTVQQEIESYLTYLYNQAESCNMIARLTLIYDALEFFSVNKKELISPAKLANHLADAEYLYRSSNYMNAKTHAFWVLKLDPENQQALRLAGLSSFHLGDYQKACTTLAQLNQLDVDAHKALMLSQVFANQQQEKHFAQSEASDNIKLEDE